MSLSTPQKINAAKMKLRMVMRLTEQAEMELTEMEDRAKRANIELTNPQAGAILGVSDRTVIRWRKSGKLKSNNFLDVMDLKRRGSRWKVGEGGV